MFDINKVTKVYSGRKGCMCGCRGKYSYASAFKSERPDYYKDDEGVSDRNVKAMVNKIEKMIADPNSDIEEVGFNDDYVPHFYVDMEHDRSYVIYFS